MIYLAIFCGIIAFLVTYFVTPWFIKFLRRAELIVKDQNKKNTPLIPVSGGLAILTLAAAVPLMVISVGQSYMHFPFIGRIEFGILFPLILVPLGVMGASNMVNLLGGYNGLEASLGLTYIGMLGLYALVNHRYL